MMPPTSPPPDSDVYDLTPAPLPDYHQVQSNTLSSARRRSTVPVTALASYPHFQSSRGSATPIVSPSIRFPASAHVLQLDQDHSNSNAIPFVSQPAVRLGYTEDDLRPAYPQISENASGDSTYPTTSHWPRLLSESDQDHRPVSSPSPPPLPLPSSARTTLQRVQSTEGLGDTKHVPHPHSILISPRSWDFNSSSQSVGLVRTPRTSQRVAPYLVPMRLVPMFLPEGDTAPRRVRHGRLESPISNASNTVSRQPRPIRVPRGQIMRVYEGPALPHGPGQGTRYNVSEAAPEGFNLYCRECHAAGKVVYWLDEKRMQKHRSREHSDKPPRGVNAKFLRRANAQ